MVRIANSIIKGAREVQFGLFNWPSMDNKMMFFVKLSIIFTALGDFFCVELIRFQRVYFTYYANAKEAV